MGRVAYVVSPHGFGHAARACAVMTEIRRRRPEISFDVFTEVPEWFFSESLADGFTHHRFDTDVGLVQHSPLIEDVRETVVRLDGFWRNDSRVRVLAEQLEALDCRLVVADIAPLGLAAAARVPLPSVLIENFTWDWIYRAYTKPPPALHRHGNALTEIFATADLTIQTEPICEPRATAVQVPPVARSPRLAAEAVRERLGVPEGEAVVVVSMGGVQWDARGLSSLELRDGPWVVVPGGSVNGRQRRGRLILLQFRSGFYHPDLVAASDVVVSKLGYSTVAEAYHAGAALGFVRRSRFPESPVLERWVRANMVSAEIAETSLRNGTWLDAIKELLKAPRRPPARANGAGEAAEIILERFGSLIG